MNIFTAITASAMGASHQTGWTGLIAALIRLFGIMKTDDLLKHGVLAPLDVVAPFLHCNELSDVLATALHDPIVQPLPETASPSGDYEQTG